MESTYEVYWKLHNNSSSARQMIQIDENWDNDSILSVVIHPQSDPDRGWVQLCHNLTAILFEKKSSPWKQSFPEVKIKTQVFDHPLPGIKNITSHYGIITNEILHHNYQINNHTESKQMI